MATKQQIEPDVSLAQLAEITGVSKQTLLTKAKTGVLVGAYRIGNMWRVRREELPALRGSFSKVQA